MGHVGMEKKNPFVMTIGFDKNDPEHVEVAEFLNSLPRKKAQYIVEAVRYYQTRNAQGNEGMISRSNEEKYMDRETIRQIVMQILEENGRVRDANQRESNNSAKEDTKELEKSNEFPDTMEVLQVDGDLLSEVRDSLAAFRI